MKTRNKKTYFDQSKTGNNSVFNNNKSKEVNLIVNNTLKLKNNKIKINKKEKTNNNEIFNKSNGLHSKDNSINLTKKPLSVKRNNNLKKKNPSNIILNYNYNIIKKRRKNISLDTEYINKKIFNNKKKKSIDFSDKNFINQSSIKNQELSIENKDNLSKTQRAKEYSIKVKNFNIGNNLSCSGRNLMKNSSNVYNDMKVKNKNRINSSVLSINNKNINSNLFKKEKKNILNKENFYINGRNDNIKNKIKSENERKIICVIPCKRTSIEDNKYNGLTSVSMSKTMYNKKNINQSLNNNKKNINLNDKKYLTNSNYAQIYLRKNKFENGNNKIIFNKSLSGLKKVK